MGAWGTGPLDNDTAADWFYKLETVPVTKMIDDVVFSKKPNPDELRAASWLLSQLAGNGYVYPIFKKENTVKEATNKMLRLASSKWIDDWNNPEEVRSNLRDEISTLESLL